MKKCLLIILIFIQFTSFAHSGRTDSNGGHYNRTTGEYHYHNKGKRKGKGIPVWVLLFGGYIAYLIIKPEDKNSSK